MDSKTTVITALDAILANRKIEKAGGKRIGRHYVILKSMKESQKNDVVNSFYFKSILNFGFCVIKEGSFGDSKDHHGRDIVDKLRWQQNLHKRLWRKVGVPKFLDSFEQGENFYLVLELVRGKTLYRFCKKNGFELRKGILERNKLGRQAIGYLIQCIDRLLEMHAIGIVHRDATAVNFMISKGGRIRPIDLELAFDVNQPQMAPFLLGTDGYMSPEQKRMELPTFAEDYYALHALVWQVITGISVRFMETENYVELQRRIEFFVPDSYLSTLICQGMHPDGAQRGNLTALRKGLTAYVKKKKGTAFYSSPIAYSKDQIQDIAQSGIQALCSSLMVDRKLGWFSQDTQIKATEKNKIVKAWYSSFNRGAAGILYFLAVAKKAGYVVDEATDAVEIGLELIKKRQIDRLERAAPGLHFGMDGVAVGLAKCVEGSLIEPESKYLDWINLLLSKSCTDLSILDGVAGQGMANLLCREFVNTDVMNTRLWSYAEKIMQLQHKDGSWIRGIANNKIRVTKGYDNGVAGILSYLLAYYQFSRNDRVLTSIERGLHWLMRTARSNKEGYYWLSSQGKRITHLRCEGGVGICLPFLQAYTLFKEPKYREIGTGALRIFDPQYVSISLSYCHGISGLGEIYRTAFEWTGDEQWLRREQWLVQHLLHLVKQTASGHYWIVEKERHPVANFMIGNSGVLHLLIRHLSPETVSYPLLPML